MDEASGKMVGVGKVFDGGPPLPVRNQDSTPPVK
jgi:hypothetical protein